MIEKLNNSNIFTVDQYPKVEIEIDFSEPLMSQNKIIQLTEEVEKNSGIASAVGKPENVGEGWVWSFEYKGILHKFKSKGEEHSKGSGKVKTLKPVDEELENKKRTFVNDVACISWRLEQMYNETAAESSEMSMGLIGTYLRKVYQDVIKEESDIMHEQGLEPKQINSMISKVAKTYFIDRLDKESGL